MTLFENLYRTLHEQNRQWMTFIFSHSQYKHECDLEQQHQREELQNSSNKSADRHHTDNSLLGSVRRRLIAPKLRVQNSHADNEKSSKAAAVVAQTTPTSTHNDSRSKTRSMTMELRRSVSRESITTNGHTNSTSGNARMMSFFSSSKVSKNTNN